MRRASSVVLLAGVLALRSASADPRSELADQIAAETATLVKTVATVDDKLAAADETRLHRVRAAMRVLHAPLALDATLEDRFASARRRAAARLLLARDTNERDLLAGEAHLLRAAQAHTAAASDKVPSIRLPEQIEPPVNGTIVRHFGLYEHERARVTLSRRGVDFDVDEHAAVVAPADGVVRYAGPIRGLDHGVILDHGDYYTVVAKLVELAIPVGTHVTRGDRLGRAHRHRVYLEVRVKIGAGGIPIDPEPLLDRPSDSPPG